MSDDKGSADANENDPLRDLLCLCEWDAGRGRWVVAETVDDADEALAAWLGPDGRAAGRLAVEWSVDSGLREYGPPGEASASPVPTMWGELADAVRSALLARIAGRDAR